MKEQQPIPGNQEPPGEIPGKLIFDKNGNCIGVAVKDGSLDYASQAEKKNTVIVIRLPKKGK